MNILHVHELQAFAQAEAQRQPVLLDVREPWELALASLRLPGLPLLAIPMHQIPARLAELPTDAPIVCLCHHGMRSADVAAYLCRRGFEAINLAGGIEAWATQVDPAVPRY